MAITARTVLLAVVLVLAFAGRADAASVMVGASGDTFTPRTTTIAAGDSVTWTFASSGHNVDGGTAFGTGPARRPVGSTFTHTFAAAGSFAYICDFHGGMTGTVNVAPTPPAPPPVMAPVDPVTGAPVAPPPGVDPAPPVAAPPPAARRRSPCDWARFGRHWCLVARWHRTHRK